MRRDTVRMFLFYGMITCMVLIIALLLYNLIDTL